MNNNVKARPPFAYYGGKQRIAERIAALLPDHDHYVEPFCGGLSVLAAKEPAHMETINDLDEYVMTFWRVLRDRPEELIRVCALTPHSRTERQRATDLEGFDELETARLVWTAIAQGRAGQLRKTGWRHHINPSGHSMGMPGYLASYVDRMTPMAERLHHVSLECMPALELIAKYGRDPRVLIYADPPYPVAVRKSHKYRVEMHDDIDHEDLADALKRVNAAVVISSYAGPLYNALYADWHRHEIKANTGQGSGDQTRTEVLWSNRPFRGAA